MEEIINRVANSPLITFDLEEYYHKGERLAYDLKDNLFQGMILREKDFRTFIKEHNWEQYQGKNVAVFCSVDAIVPTWAYMLLGIALETYANKVVFGGVENLEQILFEDALAKVDFEQFKDKKVVIKGCSNLPVPTSAYLTLTLKLKPLVTSLMFGEPCSTVPLYKKSKKKKI